MKIIALVVGLALLALGVACFIPGLASEGAVFGFPISTPLALAFIVTGAIGVMIGMRTQRPLVVPRGDGTDLRDPR